MKLSFNNEVMIHASQKGYAVNKKGDVYYKNRKRSLFPDSHGYLTFTVRIKNGNKDLCRRVWVHKLQAYQKFKDEMFGQDIQVRHMNSNFKDNSYDNIMIGSPSQNMMDKPQHVRRLMAINASSKRRVFDDKTVKKINDEYKNGMSYGKLSKKYNVGKGTLSYFFNKAIYNTGK